MVATEGSDPSDGPGGSELESTVVLLQRYRAGDLGARDRLFQRYLPILTRWAHERWPRAMWDPSTTGSDLAQQAFIRSLSHLDEFEPQREGSFLAYLRLVCLNLVRDAWRRQKMRPESRDLSESIQEPRRGPDEDLFRVETLERYEAALAKLAEKEREAVILRIEFGYSFAEVAQAIDSPSAEAARKLVARALPRIAKHMGGEAS